MLPNDKRLINFSTNKCDGNVSDGNVKKRRINDSEGLMDVKDSIISNFSMLYLSTKFSDISLKVDNETIACHKSILGSQSDFFDRLFETQMLESNQSEIELKETDPQLFRMLLKLTYFGQIDFHELSPKDIIKLFDLIQRYQFQRFEEPFLSKIETFVDEYNLWQMIDTSIEILSNDCLDICLKFLDKCKNESIFQNQHFLQISVVSLKKILMRNSLLVPEITLFSAMTEWLKHHNSELTEESRLEVIQCIRLTLIQYEDLIQIVAKTGLVSRKDLWQVLEDKALIQSWDKTFKDSQKNRAFIVHSTDLCLEQFKFQVIEGRVGTTTAPITSDSSQNEPRVVFGFAFPFNITNIEMKLSNIRGDRFSYKIEYSVEGLVWETLYDYTDYTTANNQRLVFDPIVAQQFRICGTHQTRMDVNTKTVFDSIESFACYYDKRQIKTKVRRIDGLLSDQFWIQTQVMQRVYHDSNTSIIDQNGASAEKYYSRLLSSNKPIIVALDQPVMIDSFQFLLWDRDDRAYSYIVEAKDGNDWVVLADKSSEKCRSLQTITFNRRPISLVRVKGIKIYFVDCNEFRVIKFHFPKKI